MTARYNSIIYKQTGSTDRYMAQPEDGISFAEDAISQSVIFELFTSYPDTNCFWYQMFQSMFWPAVPAWTDNEWLYVLHMKLQDDL